MKFWIGMSMLILPWFAFGETWYAVTGSYGQGRDLHGYRASVEWQPENWTWKKASIYLDFSVANWEFTQCGYEDNVRVIAAAPILRFTLLEKPKLHSYLEASAGAAYLSAHTMGWRELGSKLTFQDLLGGGLLLGKNQEFDVSLRYLHYSNANFSPKNAGIDVKWLLTLGYRF